MDNVMIKLEHISKLFPGVRALDDVSFEIQRGTTHCIIGENGAGKSTMMKILSGVQPATSGELYVDGKAIHFTCPQDALDAGIGTVYQELSNYPQLDVARNLFSGALPKKGGAIDWGTLYKQTREILDRFDLGHVDPKDMMMSHSLGTQQMIEIAKLVIRDVKVIILDEPTSALTNVEIQKLFKLIEEMKQKGVTVLFISHKLDEVKYLADEITVMKDGKHVITMPNTDDVTEQVMIRHMVGRDVGYDYKAGTTEAGELLLEVEGITSGKSVQNAGFTLHRGEVIGIAGLEGSGRTELFECIVGWRKKSAGTVKLSGKELHIKSPVDSRRNKIGYITKERKLLGLFLPMTVMDNTSAVANRRLSKKGIVQYGQRKENAQKFADSMHTKISGLMQKVMNLSGGNQQKVLLSMWMSDEPEVLLVDEPTRGVDVGAKSEIHALLRESARQGKGIVIISSEMTELMASCDRIIVMHEGKVKGELKLGEYSEEKIMNLAYGA